jgi:hypothetical protein
MWVTRMVIEVGALAIERVSTVSDRNPSLKPAPRPTCMLERENMEE